MKIAAIYNVWDGLEHLDKSISLIYPYVDHIILVWQSVSNFGEENPDTSLMVQHMVVKYPKVIHEYYTPTIKHGGTINERAKRELGINKAIKLEATHYIHVDTDEYYLEFEKGKQFVLDNDLDTSYCKMVTYFKEPTYRLEPLENYFVPFICKITSGTIGNMKVLVDPTRGANPVGKSMEVPILMHHMSFVRKDIGMKLRNSSASVNWSWQKRKEQFENWKLGDKHPFMNYDIVETENIFA